MRTIHPPGPPRGNLLRLLRGGEDGGRAGAFRRLFDAYGDLVRIPVGRGAVYLVSDVDLIQRILETDHRRYRKGRGLDNAAVLLRQGLLTSEGALHERQRRLHVEPRIDGEDRAMSGAPGRISWHMAR